MPDSTAPIHPHKFLVLDAIRGLAACIVVLFHAADWPVFGKQLLPRGYLAVDFFFMLSGFVLAFAYQTPLDKGWKTSSFLLTRLVRLYPLYLLGLLLGTLVALVQIHLGNTPYRFPNLPLSVLLALFYLPSPMSLQPPQAGVTIPAPAYPLNSPSWSLLFEILANLAHALFLRRRSDAPLLAILAVSGIGLTVSAFLYGADSFGWTTPEMPAGIFRVLFSYVAGILLFRFWKQGRGRIAVWPPALAAAMLCLLAVPLSGHAIPIYDLAVVFLAFPILLLAGASSTVSPRLAPVCRTLGLASYAIYALHFPLLQLMNGIGSHAHLAWGRPWNVLLPLAIVVAAALIADKFYDIPVRRVLLVRERTGAGRADARQRG